MKKFNINNHMYIQITEYGWKYLKKTVGQDYIKHCIESPHYKKNINGEVWYRLQCHQVFELLPINSAINPLFNTNVMFDSDEMHD